MARSGPVSSLHTNINIRQLALNFHLQSLFLVNLIFIHLLLMKTFLYFPWYLYPEYRETALRCLCILLDLLLLSGRGPGVVRRSESELFIFWVLRYLVLRESCDIVIVRPPHH